MTAVWVIESGDYEQRGVDGVASSVEAAAKFVRKPYGPPYIVTWDEPKMICKRYNETAPEEWEVTGHFTSVKGYCGTGPQTWTFTKYEISGAFKVCSGKWPVIY